MRKVLVIAAHPDDEVLGAGGAIARHIEDNDSVTVLVLGKGIASRVVVPAKDVKKRQKELSAHMRAAHKVLGAGAAIQKDFPDNVFDSIPLLSIVQEIEKVLDDVQPDLVYTHHAEDVNIDHRRVSEAVEVATRPMENGYVREVRAFEVPSSTEWNFTRAPFNPNVFVSLSESQLTKKINAMEEYASEIRPFPHPRSSEYIEALARVRGGQSGFRAAEAFVLVYRRV